MHHAETSVSAEVIQALLVVATYHVGEIEQHISMEVEVIKLLLLQPIAVASLSGHILTGAVSQRALLCGTLNRKAAIHKPYAYARREPLANSYIESRRNSVAKRSLTVMVAKVDLATCANTDKPVAPEAVCLHFIFT